MVAIEELCRRLERRMPVLLEAISDARYEADYCMDLEAGAVPHPAAI